MNVYAFSPAARNLLAGLSPTANSNPQPQADGTGPVTMLTDGAIVANNANTYEIGNSAVITYTLPTSAAGYDVTKVNIYSGWNDSGRENITITSISYSTVANPATFTDIPNSVVNYEGGTSIELASLTASGGVLASGVYAIRFNFGGQENNYVGYRELEVIGSPTGNSLSNTLVAVTGSSTLDLSPVTPSGSLVLGALNLTAGAATTAFALQNSAALALNGDAANNAISATGTAGQTASITPGANPPTLLIGAGKNVSVASGVTLTVQSVIGGSNALTKIGGGTLVLSGANTVSNSTVLNAGTLLVMGGGSCSNSAVLVVPTSGQSVTLGFPITDNTKQWTCSSLTFNTGLNGGLSSSLDFNFGTVAPSTTVAPLKVSNAATFTTTPTVTVELTPNNITVGGQYPLMTWTSTSGTAPTSVTVNVPGTRSTVTAHLTVVSTTLTLVIDTSTTTEPLSWTGGNGAWDINNSGNPIWKDSASTSVYYLDGDTVIFDNTIGSGGIVTLNTNAVPAGVTVSNPSADYTISGSGAIAGATALTKSGAGKLTLATTNTYTGVNTISAGTVNVGIAENAGLSGPLGKSGSIVLGGGTLQYSPANQYDYSGRFSTAASQVYDVDTAGQSVTWATVLPSSGGTLTKRGAGTLSLIGTETYGGATTISGGTLQLRPLSGFTIPNATFETPVYGASGWAYNPGGSSWSFTAGRGGIARNGAPWVNTAPEGAQVGFVQNSGSMSQVISVAVPGSYNFSFKGANRPTYPASDLQLLWDGNPIGSWAGSTFNNGGSFVTVSIANVVLTAGTHTLMFQATQVGADSATAIDAITITGYAGGALPSTTPVSITASGAALDLGGNIQTIASLTGVAGSSVTNHGVLTAGGDNSTTEFAGVISGGGSLTKIGSGKLTLSGVNTYTGETIFNGGIVEVASLANYGVSCSLGARSLAQEDSTVTGVSLHFQGGTLRYAGATPQSTDRNLRMYIGNGATLDASGSVPTATLSFTHTGANMNLFDTGGTRTLTLTGSNTGPNTFSILLANEGGNATSLTKNGPGTWVLNATDSTYTGVTTVNDGTLRIAGGAALGGSAGNTVIAGGTGVARVELTGGITTPEPFSLGGRQGAATDAPHISNASGINTISGLISGAAGGDQYNIESQAGLLTLSGGVTAAGLSTPRYLKLQGAGSGLISGSIVNGIDSLVLIKTNSGIWTLAGTNTYTGATLINAGELVGATGGSCSNSPVTVASGATNGVQILAAGGQWVCSNVTYSAGSTYADFNFGVITPSATVAPLLINGNLDFSAGTPTVIIRGASLPPGTPYPLITYTGSLLGTMPTAATVPGHAAAALTLVGQTIYATVTSTEPLTWLNGDGLWDLLALNWKDSQSTTTAYIDGTPGDSVVLDDTASGASPITVTLDSVFTPASVTFNLTNKNYVLRGSGSVAGITALTKTGSGSLTLLGTNTYTGLTYVNNGTFQLGDGTANNGSVGGSISNNGALIFANPGAQTYGGSISGTGGLTKSGAGVLTLTNRNTYAGTTVIGAGTLQLGGAGIPVAHYALDGTPADLAGGHNGTAVGLPSYSAGQLGQAMVLDGVSQYVTVPYTASLGLNAYTISLWVNVASQPAFQSGPGPGLVSTRNGGETTLDIQYTQNPVGTYKLHADIGNGSGWLNTGADFTLAGPLSGWNMITYTVGPGGYTIYTNGVQAAAGTFSGTPLFMKAGQELSFGSQKGGGTGYGAAGFLSGSMDEIVLIGRALTAPEVAALYTGVYLNQGVLPVTTPVQIAGGAMLDLNGYASTIRSLAEFGGSGGLVTNTALSTSASLSLSLPGGSTAFSGALADSGAAGAISLDIAGSGTQTVSGNALLAGAVNLNNSVVLNLSGNSALSGNVTIGSGATLNLNGPSYLSGIVQDHGTLNIANDLTVTGNGYFYVGVSAGTTGLVNQASGTVNLGKAGHSLLLGNSGVGNVGIYNLLGGTLNATNNVTLGVNPGTGGTLNVANGTLNALGVLDVGRSDGTANTTNSYNQWGGVASVGTLNIAPSATNICSFNITNASFQATNFANLAAGAGSVAHLVLGPGAHAVLPSFPTARGAGAVADITFDGGTLSSTTGSSNYLQGLTGAYLTANGAIFDVSNIIAVAQTLSNFGGDNGTLIKNGPGVLALAGANTHSGTTTIRAGGLYGVVGGSFSASSVLLEASAGAATLGVFSTDNTMSWSCPNLTVNNAGGGCILDFNFGLIAPSATVALLQVAGAVNFTTTPAVSVESSLLNFTGTYPLMTWGSVSGTTPTAVTVTGTSRQTTIAAHLSVVGNTLFLVVTGITTTEPLSWTGGPGTWDVNNSGNAIWKDNTGTSTHFLQLDSVVFDNTIGSGGIVNLNTVVTPLGVTVSNPSADYTIGGSGAIAGSTALSKSGAGKLTLLTTNTYSGLTAIAAGTLQLGDGTATNGSVVGNITNNAALIFANPGLQSYGGVISGTGSLSKIGAGTLALAGTNTYDGATIINAGTLRNSAIITTVTTLANTYSFSPASGNLLAGLPPSANSTTLNGQAGNFGLTGGVGLLTDGSIVADDPHTFTIGGGSLTYTLPSGAAAGYDLMRVNIYSGWDDTGRENISLTSISYSTVANPTSFIDIPNSAVNNYEGNTSIELASLTAAGGLLAPNVYAIRFNFGAQENGWVGYRELEVVGTPAVSAPGALPANTAVSITASGAALDLAAAVQTIGSLAGVAGSGVTNVGVLTVGGNGSDTEFDGVISGRGALTKTGVGKLTFTGGNTYSGRTTIRAGTLALSGSGAFANSTVITLDGGATLDASALVNGLTLGATQTLQGTNAFNVTGNVTNLGTIELKLSKTGGVTTNDSLNGLTSITYGGTLRVTQSGDPLVVTDTFKLFSAASYHGAFASFILPAPGLGLVWDTSMLAADGTLRLRLQMTGLYGTGVDDSGALAVEGSADLHYQLVASADPFYPGPQALVMTNNVWPVQSGVYMTNGPISSWISPAPNSGVGNLVGNYTYRTSFMLDTLDPSTVRIEGRWASDNGAFDVLLNGVSLGLVNNNGFASFAPFVISSGFVAGSNSLDFVIYNGPDAGPTALRVEMTGMGLPYTATPPQIVNQPADTTVVEGQNAYFTVGASGSGPLSYQWWYMGPLYGSFAWPDATNRVQPFPGAIRNQEGYYVVVVTNAYGAITSAPARLTVLVPVTGTVAFAPYEFEGLNHDGVGQRDVAFTATDGATFTNRFLQTLNFIGGVGSYSNNVPALTTRFSVKTAWTLRQRVDSLDFVNAPPTPNFLLRGGDLNGSNLVDIDDYFALAAVWYQNATNADIDGNRLVDVDDYFILASHWYQAGDAE